MEIKQSWSEFKNTVDLKHLNIQYTETEEEYYIWAVDNGDRYYCIIDKDVDTEDQQDFENNYKSKANAPQNPRSVDGKTIVRAESRPLDCTTVFTCIGDSDNNIGDGKELSWDFSNTEDEVPAPAGYRRKRLEFKFLDPVHIKEGAVYFYGAQKGSYVDFYIVCPAGNYYYDNNGNPQYATEDTIISHYVIHHMICGDCPMGDELNTESCSTEIPNTYKFWIDITVPDTDNSSYGHVSLELYRRRTVIL